MPSLIAKYRCCCRILHGMRGLKLRGVPSCGSDIMSHPSRDAWIEISKFVVYASTDNSRILHGMRGLKYLYRVGQFDQASSHPSRDAWIEITIGEVTFESCAVASFTGCVD